MIQKNGLKFFLVYSSWLFNRVKNIFLIIELLRGKGLFSRM